MKITKYEHACITLEEGGRRVIVDPGAFTDLIGPIDSVDAIVITHEHFDHWAIGHLTSIVHANPGVPIYTTAGVASELASLGTDIVSIERDQELSVAGWSLDFSVGLHAQIHASIPQPQNLGILVNESFYYAGDSFIEPAKKVHTLAAPVSAPWLKLGEVMDYVAQVKAVTVIPTHDKLLSDVGIGLVQRLIGGATESAGSSYQHLNPGDELDAA